MPEPDTTLPAEGLTLDEPDKGDARDLAPGKAAKTAGMAGFDRDTAAEGLVDKKGTDG